MMRSEICVHNLPRPFDKDVGSVRRLYRSFDRIIWRVHPYRRAGSHLSQRNYLLTKDYSLEIPVTEEPYVEKLRNSSILRPNHDQSSNETRQFARLSQMVRPAGADLTAICLENENPTSKKKKSQRVSSF
jgi:hypothetical protein